MEHVLLHIEDDPQIRDLVRLAFDSFGFRGQILTASTVAGALTILAERARQRASLELILVDMQLPDGMGLDVIKAVKSDPYWQRTPVVVLSSEDSSQIVCDSYALGANCYFPKVPSGSSVIDSLKALHDCWLEAAVLPARLASQSSYSLCLSRSVQLRARTARFYARLAKVFCEDSELMAFLLDRSLNEGNFTNLIVFLQNTFSDSDLSTLPLDQINALQDRVETTLRDVEAALDKYPPSKEEAFSLVLDIHDAWDEVFLSETVKTLTAQNPVVGKTMQSLLVDHLRKVGAFLQQHSTSAQLKERTKVLFRWVEQIAAADRP